MSSTLPWNDFLLERLLRKRGWKPARRVINRLEQPTAVMVQAGVAGLLALWPARRPRVAFCLIAAPLLALAATAIAKRAVDRPRPLSHLFQRKGLQSFPSSHTAGKTALVWMLALAFPAKRRSRLAMAGAAAADMLLLSCERVAAGAHWPTDTLGGVAIGLLASELVARVSLPRARLGVTHPCAT
jgi:undecaprenyl-diphosphatase